MASSRWHGRDVPVVIEAGAGSDSGITDDDYRGAGAEVVSDAGEAWERADLVLKVKEPQAEELRHLPPWSRAVHVSPPRGVSERSEHVTRQPDSFDRLRDGAVPERPASIARAHERGCRTHGAAARSALPRTTPRGTGRTARRGSRSEAGTRRRTGSRHGWLERGLDRAGHGGRGVDARPKYRPAALGRSDPPWPHRHPGEHSRHDRRASSPMPIS